MACIPCVSLVYHVYFFSIVYDRVLQMTCSVLIGRLFPSFFNIVIINAFYIVIIYPNLFTIVVLVCYSWCLSCKWLVLYKNHNGNKYLHFYVSSLYLMYFVFIFYVYLYSVYILHWIKSINHIQETREELKKQQQPKRDGATALVVDGQVSCNTIFKHTETTAQFTASMQHLAVLCGVLVCKVLLHLSLFIMWISGFLFGKLHLKWQAILK